MATSISDLRDANPYRNQEYKESGWQSFLSSLGFRTQADAWRENMAVQAAEYDAALLQKQYDTEYDSPAAQVDRMRSAGLNPDLDPSSISSGKSAPMGEDPSTPMQSTGDEVEILGFAGKILDAFNTCIGLTSGVQGIRKNHLENRLLKFQVDKGDTETGLSLANELFPLTIPADASRYFIDDEGKGHSAMLSDAMNMASMLTKNMNRSVRKRVMDNIRGYWSSAPKSAEAWKSWSEQVENQKGFYSGASEFYSSDSRVLRVTYKHLGRAREELEKLRMTAQGQRDITQTIEDENRQAVAEGLDKPLAAKAENAENEAKYDDAKIRSILRGTIKDILSDLDKDNSSFANMFKTLLSVLSFQYL